MTQWLSTIELGAKFGTDPYGVLSALGRLGLAEGSRASHLAEVHQLGSEGVGDTGTLEALWHPDVVTLLQGTGMAVTETPQLFETSALFDVSDFDSRWTRDEESDLGGAPGGREESGGQAATLSTDKKGLEGGAGAVGSAPANGCRAASIGQRSISVSPDSKPVGRPRKGFDRVIATDGACSGNPGPGGWAWVEQTTGARDSGGAAKTTNNIMELTALVQALEYVGPECSLLIRCDSQYVINTMTKWAPNWRRKGWKKADGKPVKNRELVERLLNLYEARTGTTEVEWVKGHAGDAANELCDTLAVAQSKKYGAKR